MDLIKESINYEQILCEEIQETVLKEEYVVPDTEPDVYKILNMDTKPVINTKDVMLGKVYIQGMLQCNVLYIARMDEDYEICSVGYTKEFSTYFDIEEVDEDMLCTAEGNVEHIECKILNERKIGIEGIVEVKIGVYNNVELEIVKDVENYDEVQVLKTPVAIDKIVCKLEGELLAKSHIKIATDKPEIGRILKCLVQLHREEVKLYDGKVDFECFAMVKILYRTNDSKEICYIQDDVFMSKEMDAEGVDSFMNQKTDFLVDSIDYDVKEDDLGEYRIIDVEALVNTYTKVLYKNEVEMIEDAYSPDCKLSMEKEKYKINLMLDSKEVETVVKDNIETGKGKPKEILMSEGQVYVSDCRLLEDKVIVEGLVATKILFKTENNVLECTDEELPFNYSVDFSGARINMHPHVNATLENIEADVEASTLAVKSLIKMKVFVDYDEEKEFIIDVIQEEREVAEKKASISIYAVQKGDTLWKIAKRYYTTIESLTKVNDILEEDVLNIGQKLMIPGRAIF